MTDRPTSARSCRPRKTGLETNLFNAMIHVTEKELLQSRIKVLKAIRKGVRVYENHALLERIEKALRKKRGAGVPRIYPEWDQNTDEDGSI